jgi:hypothetical protein
MARTTFATTIDMTGPFFRTDPARTFRQNVRVMMDAIASEAAADVIAQQQQTEGGRAPIRGVQPARVSAHVVGRTSSLAGRRWAVTAKVSVLPRGLSRKQAIALAAAASRVEGETHAFRRTTSRMRRAKAINQAELLKGLQ